MISSGRLIAVNETKEAIHEAFLKLYRREPYEKMSVKELCATTPVARTTFYSYYDNLGDLKTEIEDELVDGIRQIARDMATSGMRSIDFTAFVQRTLDYIRDNWDYNYALLVKQPSLSYMEKWKDGIKFHFRVRFPEKTNIANYDVVSEVIASGILSAYVYWMKYPDSLDAGKISGLAARVFNSIDKLLSEK